MITPCYKPAYVYGGPTRSMASLCEELAHAGHEVTVMTTDANGNENLNVILGRQHTIEGVHVFYYHRWVGDHANLSPSLLWKAWGAIKNYDIVHLHSWWNLVTMPAVLMCWLRSVRPVLSVRGTFSGFSFSHRNAGLKRWFHNLIGRKLFAYPVLHVTSAKEGAEVEAVMIGKETVVIPNFIYFPEPLPASTDQNDLFKIVFLGRLDPVKNVDFLLDVFQQEFDFKWQLDIIGDGDHDYKQQLKRKAQHNPNITWCGNLDGIEKWERLSTADLLVLPSKTENFGNVVIEALSQGTPVLLSEQVGLRDYIRKHQLGWVIPTEVKQWKEQIKLIQCDTKTRHHIRLFAPQQIKMDFNPTSLVQQYIHCYTVTARRAAL